MGLNPGGSATTLSGVTGHTVDEQGNRIGTDFPLDPTDSNSLEIRLKHKVKGEKIGFQRTAVMREFPLPEIEGYTGLMPASLTWNAIARKYRTRYVNEDLKTYYTNEAVSLSRPTDYLQDFPATCSRLARSSSMTFAGFPYAPWTFYLEARSTGGVRVHRAFRPRRSSAIARPGARLLWFTALPLGYLIYVAERLGVAHLLPGPRQREIARPRRTPLTARTTYFRCTGELSRVSLTMTSTSPFAGSRRARRAAPPSACSM